MSFGEPEYGDHHFRVCMMALKCYYSMQLAVVCKEQLCDLHLVCGKQPSLWRVNSRAC